MPIVSHISHFLKATFHSKAMPAVAGVGIVTGIALASLGPALFLFAGVNALPMALLAGGGGALGLASLTTGGAWSVARIVQLLNGGNGNSLTLDADEASSIQLFLKGHRTAEQINEKNYDKEETILHMMVRDFDAEDVAELLAAGADPTIQNAAGDAPLHIACYRGELEIVKLLTKKHPETVHARTNGGLTPLHVAAIKLRLLHDAKQKDQRAEDGITAIIKHLLRLGADPRATNKKDLTPSYFLPDEYKDLLAVRESSSLVDGEPPLIHAVHKLRAKDVKRLLRKGASPNVRDAMGLTPIHYAARDGRLIKLKLLTQGSNKIYVLARTQNQETPLHLAVQGLYLENADIEKQKKIIRHLIKAGANLKAQDLNRKRAVDYAAAEHKQLLTRRKPRRQSQESDQT